jgi:glycosyltransferase involved in cell wall biosynthesis
MDINLIAPINYLGYGVVGYNVLRALMATGNGVAYFPVTDHEGRPTKPEWHGDHDAAQVIDVARKNVAMYNPEAPSIRIWHPHELDVFPGKGERIGWPIFELNKFTPREMHHLSNVDRLFVCSRWAKHVLTSNGLPGEKIHVIPLGINPRHFYLDREELARRPYWTKKTTIFINVGKWEKRKGHNELLDAFNKAFKPGDDVELWMINDNPFIQHQNDEWKRRYSSSPMGSHVKFFPRFETQSQLRQLFHHVDCGVFPVHSEGWNLEPLELMACGAHVIATNYSGHTEYMTKDNARLIEPTGMETAQDGVFFHGHGEWCSYSVDDLTSQMAKFHADRQAGLIGLNEAGLETAKKFTWRNTAEEIVRVLS